MDNPNVSMIPFRTRTISDGEIIRTCVMETRLNKEIKATVLPPWISAPSELSNETTPYIYKFQCYRVIE